MEILNCFANRDGDKSNGEKAKDTQRCKVEGLQGRLCLRTSDNFMAVFNAAVHKSDNKVVGAQCCRKLEDADNHIAQRQVHFCLAESEINDVDGKRTVRVGQRRFLRRDFADKHKGEPESKPERLISKAVIGSESGYPSAAEGQDEASDRNKEDETCNGKVSVGFGPLLPSLD